MKRYLQRRILTTIPVFFGITLLVFLMMNLIPGTIMDLMGEGSAALQERTALRDALNLNESLPARYLAWLAGLLRGDLGQSYHFDRPVGELIAQRLVPSLLLTGSGVVLAVAIALPLGVLAAWRPRSRWDRLANALAVGSAAVPGFFLALVLIYLFSVKLRWFPASGMYDAGTSGSLGDLLRHLALPAAVVALSNVAGPLKQTRAACLEVMGEDYITTARAKGLGDWAVVVRHGLRSALIPVLTTVCAHIPHIIGGSMVVERIFGWPGMGSLMFSAISGRDYNVIMGIAAVLALAVLATNLLLDVLYVLIDPRVRYEQM